MEDRIFYWGGSVNGPFFSHIQSIRVSVFVTLTLAVNIHSM